MPASPLVLHIPHASRYIPEAVRDQYVISDSELEMELLRLTDAYTGEMFACPQAAVVAMPVSRLVVDAERFADDAQEPMAARGMGMVYELTSQLKSLRRRLSAHEREQLQARYYEPHHRALDSATQQAIDAFGRALVIDCHSFPSRPLPCDIDQAPQRPDICLGVDTFHTPSALVDALQSLFEAEGYTVAVNRPYSGTLVPAAFYQQDHRVQAIMIEVNRRLYMDEVSGDKLAGFAAVKQQLGAALAGLAGSGIQPWRCL